MDHEWSADAVQFVEPRGAGCGPALLARIARLAHEDNAPIVVMGNHADVELARSVGCDVAALLAPPLGVPRLASGAIRRLWHTFDASHAVAWSERAAVALTGLRRSVVLEARIAAVSGAMPWVEARRRARVSVSGIGVGVGEFLATRGWRVGPSLSVGDLPEPIKYEGMSREALRRRWHARKDEEILVASSDPPELLDMLGIYTVGLVSRMKGRRLRIVAHPDSGGLSAAQRFAKELKQDDPAKHVPIAIDSLAVDPQAIAEGVDLVASLSRAAAGRRELDSAVLVEAWSELGVETFSTRAAVGGACPKANVLGSDSRNELATLLQEPPSQSAAERELAASR